LNHAGTIDKADCISTGGKKAKVNNFRFIQFFCLLFLYCRGSAPRKDVQAT
jgi:hypothetical protein